MAGGSARRTPATRSSRRRSRRLASSGGHRCSTGRWPASACSSAAGVAWELRRRGGSRPVLLIRRGAAVRVAGLHADVHRRLLDCGRHRDPALGGAGHRGRARTRTWVGLAGFLALEAATFVRYTDIVRAWLRDRGGDRGLATGAARLPTATLGWWLGTVAVFVIGPGSSTIGSTAAHLRPGTSPARSGSASAHRAQPALHAGAPDAGHAHAGPRAGGARLDHAAMGPAAAGPPASPASPPAGTSRSASPWPRRGSRSGACTSRTTGPPMPSARPCSSPDSTCPRSARSPCSAPGW